MLDINFIRENRGVVENNNISRNVQVDLTALLELDGEKIAYNKKSTDYEPNATNDPKPNHRRRKLN